LLIFCLSVILFCPLLDSHPNFNEPIFYLNKFSLLLRVSLSFEASKQLINCIHKLKIINANQHSGVTISLAHYTVKTLSVCDKERDCLNSFDCNLVLGCTCFYFHTLLSVQLFQLPLTFLPVNCLKLNWIKI
jgi:hypothetical protein